ncbi:hypothetical protein D3C77_649870 [compost metagenome]
MIRLWKCYSHVFEVTSCKTNHLLFKSWDERAATEFQRVTLCLTAFECDSINRTVEIDNYSIAILSCFIVNNY